jgi:hypothetical protein
MSALSDPPGFNLATARETACNHHPTPSITSVWMPQHFALRLMNHCFVVNKIFAAHLVGDRHNFTADNTPVPPELNELRPAVAALDRRYLDYAKAASPTVLSRSISNISP